MKTYTLIGYWQNTFETWWEFSDGETPDQAVKSALQALADNGAAVEDLLIIGVIEGRHVDAVGYSFTGAYGQTEPLDPWGPGSRRTPSPAAGLRSDAR